MVAADFGVVPKYDLHQCRSPQDLDAQCSDRGLELNHYNVEFLAASETIQYTEQNPADTLNFEGETYIKSCARKTFSNWSSKPAEPLCSKAPPRKKSSRAREDDQRAVTASVGHTGLPIPHMQECF